VCRTEPLTCEDRSVRTVLAVLPLVVIVGTIAVAFARRRKPVPWGTWPIARLFGLVGLLMLIAVGLTRLGLVVEPPGLGLAVGLVGVSLFPAAMFILLTGGQLPGDDQSG
jgi:hypothetical protein